MARPVAAATAELLKDVDSHEDFASSSPAWLGAVGTRGYFAGKAFTPPVRLYRTDGTIAGTRMLVSHASGTRPFTRYEPVGASRTS